MQRRHRWRWWTIAGMWGLGTLGAAQAATLTDVFAPQWLGQSVATLEQQTGPALQTTGEQRHYQVNGCPLDVVVRQGKVVRLGTDLSAACQPNLAPFLAQRPPVVAFPQTFGGIQALSSGLHYEADCLAGCDDQHRSHLFGYLRGSPANGRIQVLFVADTRVDATFQAGQAWRHAMAANASEVYVMEGTFNCDGLMDRTAAPVLRAVVLQHVWVAQDDMDPGKCH